MLFVTKVAQEKKNNFWADANLNCTTKVTSGVSNQRW